MLRPSLPTLFLSPSRLLPAAVIAFAASGIVTTTAHAQAMPEAVPASTLLPVRDVTLFSSGVSYTLREGEVSGDATIPLTFRTTQINDILKSLVLRDENGTVRPAVYAAKDPIGRVLQSFAVDVAQPTDRVALLNRLKGARVTVQAGGTVLGPATTTEKVTIQGQIVGVDKEDGNSDGNAGSVLSILGDAGLQTVRLSEVHAVRFEDERINREFKAALGLLAAGADDKRRQVTLRFDGTGKRRVRVGYVSESPLWKISYRLLIGGASAEGGAGSGAKAADARPFLQGWALVENTTDEDWNGVHLSLVSGRPVSFIQDLYQPLYLPRPIVPPDVVASPFPQLAESNVDEKDAAANAGAVSGGEGRGGYNSPARRGLTQQQVQSAPSMVAVNGAVASTAAGTSFFGERSVVSDAAGQKAGELFAYNIATPVTLPRQQAAMIPVVTQDVGGEKVSLYNADTDPRFPMNAFRIRNNTPLHLKGGPITIFDGGTYAGDARMEDVPPGDSRLITYAVDLSVQGNREGPLYSNVATAFSLSRGVLIVSRRDRRETHYTLKNKADRARTVLVEHPYEADCKLVQPDKAASRTATHYRFEVTVAPGATEKLTVITEQPIGETVALLDADAKSLESYTTRGDVSNPVKEALREVIARRRKMQDLQSQAATAEAEIKSIDTDQDRIRKNMEALDHASALYKRYVSQLDAQETRIQALRTEAARLRSAVAAADRELRAYLDGLTVAAG